MSKKIKRHYDCYARMADELRSERLLKRVTQQQVADALGCSRRTVGNIEDYSIKPSPEQLRKLSVFFGRPEDYFSNLIDKETEEPETVYPETKEEFVNLSDRRENCRPCRCVINTLKEMLTLKDEVLDRIFDGIEDALVNPANIKGCELCSGRDK